MRFKGFNTNNTSSDRTFIAYLLNYFDILKVKKIHILFVIKIKIDKNIKVSTIFSCSV